MAFEIKSYVSKNIQVVPISHLTEALIYSFYILKVSRVPTLYIALTNTLFYHIFHCALKENGRLHVQERWCIENQHILATLKALLIVNTMLLLHWFVLNGYI